MRGCLTEATRSVCLLEVTPETAGKKSCYQKKRERKEDEEERRSKAPQDPSFGLKIIERTQKEEEAASGLT